jgi:pimeloyl-ACP methyl ester carboxylesterase
VSPAAEIASFSSATADLDGVRLHYRLGGDPSGPPVLLWHGFLGTSYSWRRVATELAGAGMAVLVPDMRGYGDSDKPAGVEGYDARALAAEFRRLVAALDFGGGAPLVIAAHDMGAPGALIWAADHPEEVAGLVYVEEPVVLAETIGRILAWENVPRMNGSLWWWLIPHAPNAPERLIVGNERNFLTWFYDRDPSTQAAIEESAIAEYLRTFSGTEGVLGALGVYRAVPLTMEQTATLKDAKVEVPIVALGGERALGDRVGQMLGSVAADVVGEVVTDCSHFLPEEAPEAIVRRVLELAGR